MSVIQSCHDTKDLLPLFRPLGLYLKPIARLNISVQLPQLKKTGSKISNWEVMERVKDMAKGISFPVFKVAKSSLEFIRFEAEIENYGKMDEVKAKLDMKTIKLSGFEEHLKVRAAEAKPAFPTRHDWDTFFKDNKNMNEMKAGERPDTIHLSNLPTKWFVDYHDRSGIAKDKPSEYVLKKVFENPFASNERLEIRALDIPILDPYRNQMKSSISGIQTFSFGQDLVFDAFIQFKEYIGFVKVMNSLKGMKLLYKDRHEERAWTANIKVDFDKTKHLAESTIKKRKIEREKLVEKEREKEEAERKHKEIEEMKRADDLRKMKEKEREEIIQKEAQRSEKIRRRMEREERRRQRKLSRKNVNDEEEMNRRIAIEERKLLVAQRKLESIRMLDELLERVKVVHNVNKDVKTREKDLLKTAKNASKRLNKGEADITSLLSKDNAKSDEKELRDKLVSKLKQKEIDKIEACGENLKQSCLYSDDSMEEISDEDLDDEDSAASEKLDEISDNDELRLTSTDNDESAPEDGPKATDEDKNKLKSKKKKKEKKKKRRKDEKREKDEKKDKKNKRKELERQIFLAQRITDRDRGRRSRSRDRNRHSSPKRDHWRKREKTWEEERMEKRIERENLIRERQLRLRLEDKRKEQAQFEVYDKMVNPHLYGVGGYSARRLKKGEHYEDVQKELLENEIRIQTRRARYKHQNNDHQRNHRGSSGPAGGGYHRSDRGHGGRSSWIIAKGGSSRSYR